MYKNKLSSLTWLSIKFLISLATIFGVYFLFTLVSSNETYRLILSIIFILILVWNWAILIKIYQSKKSEYVSTKN